MRILCDTGEGSRLNRWFRYFRQKKIYLHVLSSRNTDLEQLSWCNFCCSTESTVGTTYETTFLFRGSLKFYLKSILESWLIQTFLGRKAPSWLEVGGNFYLFIYQFNWRAGFNCCSSSTRWGVILFLLFWRITSQNVKVFPKTWYFIILYIIMTFIAILTPVCSFTHLCPCVI